MIDAVRPRGPNGSTYVARSLTFASCLVMLALASASKQIKGLVSTSAPHTLLFDVPIATTERPASMKCATVHTRKRFRSAVHQQLHKRRRRHGPGMSKNYAQARPARHTAPEVDDPGEQQQQEAEEGTTPGDQDEPGAGGGRRASARERPRRRGRERRANPGRQPEGRAGGRAGRGATQDGGREGDDTTWRAGGGGRACAIPP